MALLHGQAMDREAQSELNKLRDEGDRLTAENARLREAIENITRFVDEAQFLSSETWRRKLIKLLAIIDLGALMAGVEPVRSVAKKGG